MSDEERGGPKPKPKGTLVPNPSVPGVQTPNKPDALGLVDDHTRHCLKDPRRADEHADELMDAVGRMLSR